MLGSNGRIGRLLTKVWGDGRAYGLRTLWQHRKSTSLVPSGLEDISIALDPMTESEALAEHARGMDALLVLTGVTPSSGPANPDYSLNASLAQAALKAARMAQVPRVLLTSSGAVYGPGLSRSESTPTAPVHAYGHAKVEMEQLANSQQGVTSLRIGNVAGADQLLGPGRRNVTLDVFEGDKGPLRSYIGPKAFARILADLLRHPETLPKCLNVSAPSPVDMADLLRAANIPFATRAAPAHLPKCVSLDTSALDAIVPLSKEDSRPETIVGDWIDVTGGTAL